MISVKAMYDKKLCKLLILNRFNIPLTWQQIHRKNKRDGLITTVPTEEIS